MALLNQEAGIATESVFGFLLIMLFGVVVWLKIFKSEDTKKEFSRNTRGGRRKNRQIIKKRR